MIVTDKFIYIHFPKAGGTFITKIVDRLYSEKIIPAYQRQNFVKRLISPKPFYLDYRVHSFFEGVLDERNNHNGYAQIEKIYSSKPVFTTVRNPFDFYVSYFETKKWINDRTMKDTELKQFLPSFPNLNFEDFLRFLDFYYVKKVFKTITGQEPIEGVGLYTLLFVFLYSENPLDDFSRLKTEENNQWDHFNIAKKITFLDYSSLNDEFHAYLNQFFSKSDIDFLYLANKENVSPYRKSNEWKGYYNDETHDLVTRIDKLGIQFFDRSIAK